MGGQRFKNEEDKNNYYASLTNMFKFIKKYNAGIENFGKITDQNIEKAEKSFQKLVNDGYLILNGKVVPYGTEPQEIFDFLAERTDKADNAYSEINKIKKERSKYVALINDGAKAEEAKKDAEKKKAITENRGGKLSEKELKDLEAIKKKYEAANQKSNEAQVALAKLKSGPSDPAMEKANWLFILDNASNEYAPVFMVKSSDIQVQKYSKDLYIENANTLKSVTVVQDELFRIDNDLESTQYPWSSDSTEYKQVKQNVHDLFKKLENKDVFESSSQGLEVTSQKDNYEELEKDFNTVISSINEYAQAHRDLDELSPRQKNRLTKMNELQTVIDAIRVSEKKNIALTKAVINKQLAVDRLCMTMLKNFGDEDAYNAALTDRTFFLSVRKSMLDNPCFKKDLKNLKLDGITKLSDKALKQKDYLDSDAVYEALDKVYGFTSKEKKSIMASVNEGNYKFGLEFTGEEKAILAAYAAEADMRYEGSGENGSLTSEDYNQIYGRFLKDVRAHEIVVFNQNGELAEPTDALHLLTDKLNYQDGKQAFYRYEMRNQAYVGRSFDLKPTAVGKSPDVSGFKANHTEYIRKDYFQICNAVLKEVGNLRKDLYEARSFHHSKEHKELESALEDVYTEFEKADFSESDSMQFQKAFASLSDKAEKYIQSHFEENINDKQMDRLIVAQKILSMNKSISEPRKEYSDYLKEQYAKKAVLDYVRIIDGAEKNYAKNGAPKDMKPKDAALFQKDLKEENRKLKWELTYTGITSRGHKSKEAFSKLDVKNFMDSSEFKQRVDGKTISELENMLREEPKTTYRRLNMGGMSELSFNDRFEEKRKALGQDENKPVQVI